MQTHDALERVAAECAEDLADDGVVYAEVRFAPELHLDGGLTLDEVVRGRAGRLPPAAAPGAPDRDAARCSRRCAPPPARWRSPSSRSASATRASSASTSPAPRRATRPAATWMRST